MSYKKPRSKTWYWSLWWFLGYHGLYQLDWRLTTRSWYWRLKNKYKKWLSPID